MVGALCLIFTIFNSIFSLTHKKGTFHLVSILQKCRYSFWRGWAYTKRRSAAKFGSIY